MLEQINLTKKLGKGEYKKRMDRLEPQLALLQRECKRTADTCDDRL